VCGCALVCAVIVDKYGQRVPTQSQYSMKKFYRLPSESDSDSEPHAVNNKERPKKFRKTHKISKNSAMAITTIGDARTAHAHAHKHKPAHKPKLAHTHTRTRAHAQTHTRSMKTSAVGTAIYTGFDSSSTSDSDSSNTDDNDNNNNNNNSDNINSDNNNINNNNNNVYVDDVTTDNIPTGDATSRFAVLNIDWQYMRALDLFVLFQSFLPSAHAHAQSARRIVSVTVYPSDYGLEKMAEVCVCVYVRMCVYVCVCVCGCVCDEQDIDRERER